MKDKKAAKSTPESPQISALGFPALREFLRGYLHEDWQEEYDSPAKAAQQFCTDASPQERQDVAREWSDFRSRTKNLSLPVVSGLLNDKLGASWTAKSTDDLEAISAVFHQFARKI
jgi:CdiI immunity protein